MTSEKEWIGDEIVRGNSQMCEECYSNENRVTPLLHPLECLQNHTQYICGTCGRCICIEQDEKRGLQRWHFPFKSLEIAKLYLRAADYTMKKPCGIYEMTSEKGRTFYKIFADVEALKEFLKHHKDKHCEKMKSVFRVDSYKEYPYTEVRSLSDEEIMQYMSERK